MLANRVLPVLAIKMMRLQCREINIINAARVNVDFVRIRSWHIERWMPQCLQNVCLATPVLNV